MNTTISKPNRTLWLGTACCLLAATGYTGANICLRQLAELKVDPTLAIFLKETVAVFVLGPWIVWQWMRGTLAPIHRRALLILFLSALAVQLIGNLGVQWSLGVVGLVISLPMVFGALLIGSAAFGMIVFRESLSRQSIIAVLAVIASIILLSVGATDSRAKQGGDLNLTLLAIIAAGIGGTVYALMGGTLRYVATRRIPLPVIVVVVTGTGTLVLGSLCVIRFGPTAVLATDGHILFWTSISGLCNVVAFSLITKGIQLTTLVHANVLNASQVALGSLAGVLLFHEPYNLWLVAGIALTVLGIALFGKPIDPSSTKG